MVLTKLDLQKIGTLIDQKVDIKFDEKFDELKEEMRKWRDDFYTKIDPILKEVTDSREERTILSHRVSGHADRIEKLEESVFKS